MILIIARPGGWRSLFDCMNRGKLVKAGHCTSRQTTEMPEEKPTLNVRSWARGEVLKYSKMESWKSGSFRPVVKRMKLFT